MVSRSTHQSITHLLFLSFLATAFIAHGMHDRPQGSIHGKQKERNQLSRLGGFWDSLVVSGHSQYTLQHPLSEHERNAVEGVGRLIPAVEMRLEINQVFFNKEQASWDEMSTSSGPSRDQATQTWKRACADIKRWHTEKAEVNKIDQERLAQLDPVLSRHPAIRELFRFDADHFPLAYSDNTQQIGMLEGAGNRVNRLLAEDDKLKRAQGPAHKKPEVTSKTEEKAAIASTIAQGGVLPAQRRRGSVIHESRP